MKNFLIGVLAEMKRVKWPTPRELVNLVLFTVIACAIIAIIMLGLDVFFLNIQEILLNL